MWTLALRPMKRVVMLRYSSKNIPSNSLKRYDDRPSAVQRRRRLRKRQFKTEFTRIRFCLKADIFFSGFAYCPHVSGENSHRKWIFSKNALQSGDFWKRQLFIYAWTDENGGFRIRWCHVLLAWRMLREGCYHIYIVVAFSWGQAKKIRIRYVRMRIFFKRWKNSPFSKISGYVWPGPKCDLLVLLQTYLFYFFQVVKC